jgi:NAD(P)H-hydrate epimerase
MTCGAEELSPDARTQHARLAGASVEIGRVPDDLSAPGSATRPEFAAQLQESALCIDALLGTGIERAVSDRLAAVIAWINVASRRVLAVDIPSGVDGNTGAVHGTAVRAHVTVTLGLPKLGLAFHPGRGHVGRLVVADIGFPADILREAPSPWEWYGIEAARQALPALQPTAHKYSRGTVVVVAGSRAYPGAAALAASGAQRAGAGIVHLVAPASIRDVLEVMLPEVIVHPVGDAGTGAPAAEALHRAATLVERAQAVVVGPGVGADAETQAGIRRLLARLEVPAVVDAEAIAALHRPPHPGPRIITPHAGELARWSGLPGEPDALARAESAASLAHDWDAVLLAKGAPTVVLTPEGRRIVNGSGNAGLATAGSGDVLAGIVGAFLAQGMPAAEAAALAAFVHGRTAESLSERVSTRSLIARDLASELGAVLRALELTA